MTEAQQEAPTDRNIVKTVSMKASMVDAVERRALAERHSNFSRVVVSALAAYLATPVATDGEAA
jgi:hypothetical protein